MPEPTEDVKYEYVCVAMLPDVAVFNCSHAGFTLYWTLYVLLFCMNGAPVSYDGVSALSASAETLQDSILHPPFGAVCGALPMFRQWKQ